MRKMLTTDYSEGLDALFALSDSSGGARLKILTVIDGEGWIVKLPSSYDGPDIGAQEYALVLAARVWYRYTRGTVIAFEVFEGDRKP